MNFELLISYINSLALIAYFMIVGAGLSSMGKRARRYRVAEKPWPILLKRAIGLYLGLAAFGGLILGVRVTGIVFEPNSLERLIFVMVTVASLLLPLGYYTKTDIFDLDNPEKT